MGEHRYWHLVRLNLIRNIRTTEQKLQEIDYLITRITSSGKCVVSDRIENEARARVIRGVHFVNNNMFDGSSCNALNLPPPPPSLPHLQDIQRVKGIDEITFL